MKRAHWRPVTDVKDLEGFSHKALMRAVHKAIANPGTLFVVRRPKVRGPKPGAGSGALPPVSSKPPKHAAWLNKRAREIFADLVHRLNDGPGASETHAEAINLCAARLAEVERLRAVLDEKGSTYEAQQVLRDGETVITTGVKARPEYAQCSEAMRHAAALLVELGLTPAAQGRVKAGRTKGGQATGFEDID
jgi:phage terminase small subunit